MGSNIVPKKKIDIYSSDFYYYYYYYKNHFELVEKLKLKNLIAY